MGRLFLLEPWQLPCCDAALGLYPTGKRNLSVLSVFAAYCPMYPIPALHEVVGRCPGTSGPGGIWVHASGRRDRPDEGFSCWALFFRQLFQPRWFLAVAFQVVQEGVSELAEGITLAIREVSHSDPPPPGRPVPSPPSPGRPDGPRCSVPGAPGLSASPTGRRESSPAPPPSPGA